MYSVYTHGHLAVVVKDLPEVVMESRRPVAVPPVPPAPTPPVQPIAHPGMGFRYTCILCLSTLVNTCTVLYMHVAMFLCSVFTLWWCV